ncbi:MAG: ubiquinone/menaquinone biosynthesis methyltransferase [Vicinamibacterales bacterium]
MDRSSRTSLGVAIESPDGKREVNRRIFTAVAPRYDFITRVLSYGQDQRWKRRLIEQARIEPGERVLDLACGTGDLADRARARGARVAGLDLTRAMLSAARHRHGSALSFVQADMMHLPFTAARFDVVTAGYALRNLPDLNGGLREIARVLKPGGRLLSLDFERPSGALVRTLFLGYLWAVGSVLGMVLHREPETYRYISVSLSRYPSATELRARLSAAGFRDILRRPLLGGLMATHTAVRCGPATASKPVGPAPRVE